MLKSEIQSELDLSYLDLCDYLTKKYGSITEPYFLDKQCTKPNQRIKRGNEGLFVHHIAENKHIMLCNSQYAQKHSFIYQEGYNLVYCNYLEHLILHYKIVEEYAYTSNTELLGIGGLANFIVPMLNTLYSEPNIDNIQGYQRKAFELIKDNYIDFLKLKKKIQQLVSKTPKQYWRDIKRIQ